MRGREIGRREKRRDERWEQGSAYDIVYDSS